MMKIEEYKAEMEAGDWSPGWEAIDSCFEKLYGNQEPVHYATEMISRPIFGGNEYLDGYSFFHSSHQEKHLHLVTYGMSQLYADIEKFGKDYSKWGYEMTLRLLAEKPSECVWAMNMLGNLARYTNTKDNAWFEVNQFVVGDGSSIELDSDSKITSLIIVEDPELPPIQTVHGSLEFLQMVGVTWDEMNAIRHDRKNLEIIIENMKKENPLMITDMKRTKNYLEGAVLA